MIIRNAEVGDSADIVELLAQLGYPGTQAFVPEKIERLLGHRDAELLVAEDGGRLLGFIGLHFMVQLALPGDFCRITYFCVSDSARGSGVGRALEEAAASLAVGRGCDRIEVHCHERRVDAHRFYYRQGYEESPKYLMKRCQRLNGLAARHGQAAASAAARVRAAGPKGWSIRCAR